MGERTGRSSGEDGGARRDRTADLLHAMQALSQLSYGPECFRGSREAYQKSRSVLPAGGTGTSGTAAIPRGRGCRAPLSPLARGLLIPAQVSDVCVRDAAERTDASTRPTCVTRT